MSSILTIGTTFQNLTFPAKATAIQHVYRSYLHDQIHQQQVEESTFSHKVSVLECNMALAMWDLEDSDDFIQTVSNPAGSSASFVWWHQVIWMPHEAIAFIWCHHKYGFYQYNNFRSVDIGCWAIWASWPELSKCVRCRGRPVSWWSLLLWLFYF